MDYHADTRGPADELGHAHPAILASMAPCTAVPQGGRGRSPGRGVEGRLPALPSVKLGRRAWGAALLGGWLLVVHGAWAAPGFRVSQVEILGTELLRTEHVRSIAGVTGDRVFSVDPEAIEARLEGYAEGGSAPGGGRWRNPG